MRLLIVDASCVAAWALEEHHTDWLSRLLDQIAWDGAIVPAFWGLELANAILSAAKSRRVAKDKTKSILFNVGELNIIVDRRTQEMAFTKTFELAQRRGLTMYDAAYLELAIRHGAMLATLDKALGSAARAEGLLVLPELAV